MADDRDLLLEEEDLPSPSPAKKPAPVPPVQVVLSPEAIDALFQIRKNELDKQEDRIKNLLSTADAKRSELSDAFRKTIQADLKEYREEQYYNLYKKWWQRFAYHCFITFVVALLAVVLFSFYYERTKVYVFHKEIAEAWDAMKKQPANENAAKPEDASVKKPAEKKK